MVDLKSRLSSFGLLQYHERLVEAGFDTWETILDITENDLECLSVPLGYRRRLQQEIAHTLSLMDDTQRQRPELLSRSLPQHTKRQYTHHPKPDPNAPQRPRSAYVIFSDSLRGELKGHALSFTQQSKIAGERWQDMPDSAKASWKQATDGAWNKYRADKLKYQDSDPYRRYQEYLAEFNDMQSSKKRKVLSNRPAHEVIEIQTDLAPSSDPHQNTALKRVATIPGFVPTKSITASPSASVSDRQRSLMSDFGGSYSPDQLNQPSNPQRYGTACESCKKKKIRCNGGRPACERCRKSNLSCFYAGGIRDKEQRYGFIVTLGNASLGRSRNDRLMVNAIDKLRVCEQTLRRIQPQLEEGDQSDIRQLLNMSPHADEAQGISYGKASRKVPDDSNEETSDGPGGGEDDASNVGSMGSTDHLNEESFAEETGNERIHSFLGQTASDTWVERIKHNLKISDADEPENGNDPTGDHSPPRPNELISRPAIDPDLTSSTRASMVPEDIDPYELPTRSSADFFVAAFFAAVHPVFPIFSRDQFLWNYETFFDSTESGRWSTSAFVPTLHVVLAIGAVHTYVTNAGWFGDERSRLLRFARAKASILDACILGASAYEQVQLCGIGGLYMFIMNDINRAWNLAGLAIRCAQALGLHLVNRTPGMTESQMKLRSGLWASVLSLERTVAIVTGRPSMVRDRDCTATLPPDGLMAPDMHHGRVSTSNAASAPTMSDCTTFFHYVELSSLADLVLAALYSAHVRHRKWSELQATIRELDQKACDWNTSLSRPFGTDPSCQTPEQDSARVAIGMFFYSVRILVNRPCLCRLDRRIEHQSESSGLINAAAADRCVNSARSILGLLDDNPSPAIIYHGPFWWMGFHHLKRATTVLIQEITLRSENTSAAGADIMTDAIKAINWLHTLGLSSSPAYSAWVTLSRLLLLAAQEFGGDLSGARIADPSLQSGNNIAKEESQREIPEPAFGMQYEEYPIVFGEQEIGENMFSDGNSNAWDQLFGLGQESFFPMNSELDNFYGANERTGER
ncbi:MAG: hypothetical protein Q9204_002410 [Flavoplaca sp. TL-2023a]